MKKLIFSLAMVLMLGVSAGAFAANEDLGPELNTVEGYAGLNLPLELSGGARKWMRETPMVSMLLAEKLLIIYLEILWYI